MNIAFYTDYECCPSIGGTERTTTIVAESIKKEHGYKSFSLYKIPVDKEIERYQFEKSLCIKDSILSDKQFIRFINDNDIKIIVNQGNFHFGVQLQRLIQNKVINCRQLFALHYSPGSFENAFVNWNERKRQWKRFKNIKETLKILLYPLFYLYIKLKFKNYYNKIENLADRIVLLSNNYIKEWNDYAHHGKLLLDNSKFIAIPNGVSFNHFADDLEIKDKENRVLIVARLDERQKKLTKALDIWKQVGCRSNMSNWVLDIVGTGPDKELYETKVKVENIPNVIFHGHQNPQPYYKRSSIFMMTSDFEGFSMTLVEASQYGVIPFVLNTFSSVEDIITDGENGFIFEKDDLLKYENKMVEIANNESERFRIARNAVNNSKRFSSDIIASMWHSVICDICL